MEVEMRAKDKELEELRRQAEKHDGKLQKAKREQENAQLQVMHL
jgi:hypothetical protein